MTSVMAQTASCGGKDRVGMNGRQASRAEQREGNPAVHTAMETKSLPGSTILPPVSPMWLSNGRIETRPSLLLM